MLVSDVLGVVQATLLDPSPGVYWPNAELITYANQFFRYICPLKPDLLTARTYVTLVAGSDQTLPADGHTFLEAYFAGNGQAVFVMDMEDVKHAHFSNLAQMTASAYPKVVCADPRDPRRYHCFPRNTGASGALEILYGKYPVPVTAVGDTWPLPDESQDPAYHYLLSLSYGKQTDRQDLNKSSLHLTACQEWIKMRTAAQAGEGPKADA